MARRRYRRPSSTSGAAIVGDVISVANSASCCAALLLGIAPWLIIAFALPASNEHQQGPLDSNMFRQMVDEVFALRIHWLTWIGTACLTAGAFFAVKTYTWRQPVDRDERRLVASLVRLLGRSID